MFTVCVKVARPRFEVAVLSLEYLHLLEQSQVLTLDRRIRAGVGVKFDGGLWIRFERVGNRRGCPLHRCTLVGDRVLKAREITLPEAPHATGVRVDETAECAIEQFLTRRVAHCASHARQRGEFSPPGRSRATAG